MDELNERQKKAVLAPLAPVLVLAGAGTGKTRTISARIAHLVEKGEELSSILAITFTNKAAKEMKERVEKNMALLSFPEIRWNEPWMGFSNLLPEISTFHSFCLKVLRQESELLNYPRTFAVYDSLDQLSLVRKAVKLVDPEEIFGNPKAYQAAINQAKTKNISPQNLPIPEEPFEEKLIEIYASYQRALYDNQAMDFGDLIMNTLHIFSAHSSVLEKYQNRFRHIMVDEYQDTNKIQYELISILAKKEKNIFVVGDEDQSIYHWRGANIRNILNFQKDYPEALVLKLEENYRSTKNIIEAASHVISNNMERYDKVLFTQNPSGSLVQVSILQSEVEEARYLIKKIKEYISSNPSQSYNDIAVFYRSHAQSRIIEEEFRKERLPHKIVAGLSFYERKEIKDILAYMRILVNPQDSFSLLRIINSPSRGIGKTSLKKIENYANEKSLCLYQVIKEISLNPNIGILSSSLKAKVKNFYLLIEELRSLLQKQDLNLLYESILHKSAYWESLERENSEEAQERMDNLKELSSVLQLAQEEMSDYAEKIDSLSLLTNFLNQISLESKLMETGERAETGFVSFMTLHASKGLEFPLVFLVGCEEGIFPSQRAIHSSSATSSIEEERRLCYVGMSRAKSRLILCAARVRRIHGRVQVNRMSRFLQEIPEKLRKMEDISFSSSYSPMPKYPSSSKLHSSKKQDLEYHYEYEREEMPSVYENMPQIGSVVQHELYGKGTVEAVRGTVADRSLLIRFKNSPPKTFKLKYAKLKLLDEVEDNENR